MSSASDAQDVFEVGDEVEAICSDSRFGKGRSYWRATIVEKIPGESTADVRFIVKWDQGCRRDDFRAPVWLA
jgi:hypothetical protein